MEEINIINGKNVVSKLLKDDVIVQSFVYSYRSSKYWKIQKEIKIELSNGKFIVIPKGFYYDMSTVPKWLWSIVRPYNDGLLGYLIHDYLYIYRDHGMTRKQCDKEMLFWTNITNENKFDNYLRYLVVRLLGWIWWYKII